MFTQCDPCPSYLALMEGLNCRWTAVARGAAIRGQKVAQSLASLETYIAPETYIIEAGGYSATILSKVQPSFLCPLKERIP